MEKVYMARIDNYYKGKLSFTDNHGAFKTFRGASQWLVDEGLEPTYDECCSEVFGVESIVFMYEDKENNEEHIGYVDTYSVIE